MFKEAVIENIMDEVEEQQESMTNSISDDDFHLLSGDDDCLQKADTQMECMTNEASPATADAHSTEADYHAQSDDDDHDSFVPPSAKKTKNIKK